MSHSIAILRHGKSKAYPSLKYKQLVNGENRHQSVIWTGTKPTIVWQDVYLPSGQGGHCKMYLGI